MKLFRMLGRSIRDAFKSVFRNFSLSLASISCITITLIIVAVSMMASVNVENFTDVIEKDVTMVVFLNNEVEAEEISKIEEQIKSIANVDTYVFKSKTKVKEEMQATSEVFDSIMKDWKEEEELKLYDFLDKANNKNIKFALSNVMEHKGKENKLLEDWSKKYKTIYLENDYSNSSYNTKKGKSKEVLIINY